MLKLASFSSSLKSAQWIPNLGFDMASSRVVNSNSLVHLVCLPRDFTLDVFRWAKASLCCWWRRLRGFGKAGDCPSSSGFGAGTEVQAGVVEGKLGLDLEMETS